MTTQEAIEYGDNLMEILEHAMSLVREIHTYQDGGYHRGLFDDLPASSVKRQLLDYSESVRTGIRNYETVLAQINPELKLNVDDDQICSELKHYAQETAYFFAEQRNTDQVLDLLKDVDRRVSRMNRVLRTMY